MTLQELKATKSNKVYYEFKELLVAEELLTSTKSQFYFYDDITKDANYVFVPKTKIDLYKIRGELNNHINEEKLIKDYEPLSVNRLLYLITAYEAPSRRYDT